MPSIAIITVYHFSANNLDPYARLVRGLRSLTTQLQESDRLILVANGTRNGAEDPDRVLKELDSSHPERIIPVVMLDNNRAAGGLNVGVAAALRSSFDWIGQVQSSVVIGSGWLESMRLQISSPNVHGVGGRLVYEEQLDTIYTDGHYLKEGRTLDQNYGCSLNKPEPIGNRWLFPCLSAALFSSETVRLICDRYGDFVTEQLPHYGDCTDVALRCAKLKHREFLHVPEALGTKRRPSFLRGDIVCSQLLAARRYYSNHFEKARNRVRDSQRDSRFLEDSVRRCEKFLSVKYSPKEETAPVATSLEDQKWGKP